MNGDITEVRIADVRIDSRHRKEMGDIAGLARSIAELGLLHPIGITSSYKLLFGERRLRAFQHLGLEAIPARFITSITTAAMALNAERDENAQRADFAPGEAVALGRELEVLEREAAKERQGTRTDLVENCHDVEYGKTRDRVASALGMSGKTYEKAKAVVEAAESDPERYGDLVQKMNKSGRVAPAHKELKRRQDKQRRDAAVADLPKNDDNFRIVHAPCRAALDLPADSVDWIITDPPYPQEFLPVYSELSAVAAHALKPGGSLLVMTGEMYLPEVIRRLAEHMTYHWTAAYLTPGGQAVQVHPRRVNTFWKPVLWFVKGSYSGRWVGDVTRSRVNDNDKDHHHWGQSESGMADIIERFTEPGDTILDPFVGGGTTGVVAIALGRRFIGYDLSDVAVAESIARIQAVRAA